MIDSAKRAVKKVVFSAGPGKHLAHGLQLYPYYHNEHPHVTKKAYLKKHFRRFYVQPKKAEKAQQIRALLKKVDLAPVASRYFYYSIDCFKKLELQNPVFDNYSVDYTPIVHASFAEIRQKLDKDTVFSRSQNVLIDAMHDYLTRMQQDETVSRKYPEQIRQIASLFSRPAQSFREALQRILFYNQFLWQTGHKHNGFGHLDWMLIDLYRHDIAAGIISASEAKDILLDFFRVLHENCWYKSTMLLGDTGQIIILGGLQSPQNYVCNELTYLFIEVSIAANLPDPKVLLRCSTQMPDDLLDLALTCIATGIGAPFLSNDDAVIPRLIDYGYAPEHAYNYATAACWEPLILNVSCDQNNAHVLNFATPLNRLLDSIEDDGPASFEDVLQQYKQHLAAYIQENLQLLSTRVYEEAPLFSMLSDSALARQKDLLCGGALYSNLGLTTVGMANTVNSLINIRQYVFQEKRLNFCALNRARKENYANGEDLVKLLSSNPVRYGCDDPSVLDLTNHLTQWASQEFSKYSTYLGGKFKFGLSSPDYVNMGRLTDATCDGRKAGQPLAVHISADGSIAATEIIHFATKLDYSGNRLNGNVVDLMVTPGFLKDNKDKFLLLLKAGFANGLYQMQINVLDSATILAARKDPSAFPNLIVRVWGFSAYFKDLPEEYQQILVQRALQNEAMQRG